MDEISERSYRVSVGRTAAKCFADWNRIPADAWAQEIYRLPSGRRFGWDFAPYTRRMFDSMFDPSTIETVLQLYSRGLKSTVILLAIGYVIDQSPRRILSLWPTNSQAEKWSKDNLCGELLDTTPCLQYLGSSGNRRLASNTILHKAFPGGLIDIFGANAPGDMRRAKGSFLYGDEIDAIDSTVSDEGDQLAIFAKRGDEYPDTIRVFASYPSLIGYSRIQSKLDATDYNEWHSTCVKCGGEPFVMHRKHLRYEEGKEEEARLECPRCNALLTDAERYAMAHKQGFDCWKPRNPFRGRRGFHGNSMLWPHPTDPRKVPGGYLQMLALDEVKAKQSENPRRSIRVMVNTVDAEPFDPAGEDERAPDYITMMRRREPFGKPVIVPDGGLVITAAVDVHKNRLECGWVAWGEREESWVIDHVVLPGECQDDAVWKELEKELSRTWKHESGGMLSLSMSLVDAGKWPDWVYRFLQRRPLAGKIRACRGSSVYPHPIIDQRYKSIARNLHGHWVGGDAAKDLLYSRFRAEKSDPLPDGWIHFADTLDEVWFQQATSEKVSIVYKGGEEHRRYLNEDHARNEALDVLVYNLAAFRLRRWNFDAIRADLAKGIQPDAVEEPPQPPRAAPLPGRGFGMQTGRGWRV